MALLTALMFAGDRRVIKCTIESLHVSLVTPGLFILPNAELRLMEYVLRGSVCGGCY